MAEVGEESRMENKNNKSRFKKHLVVCPSCGKDVLDHMTECPFCQAKLSPDTYTPLDPKKLRKIRNILTVIGMIIALVVYLLTR